MRDDDRRADRQRVRLDQRTSRIPKWAASATIPAEMSARRAPHHSMTTKPATAPIASLAMSGRILCCNEHSPQVEDEKRCERSPGAGRPVARAHERSALLLHGLRRRRGRVVVTPQTALADVSGDVHPVFPYLGLSRGLSSTARRAPAPCQPTAGALSAAQGGQRRMVRAAGKCPIWRGDVASRLGVDRAFLPMGGVLISPAPRGRSLRSRADGSRRF
jgi:hypothetical protein